MQEGCKPSHVCRSDQKELKGEKLILGSELPPASYRTGPAVAPYHVPASKSPSQGTAGGAAKDRAREKAWL